MAISRFSTSRLTQGLPKYQTAWDSDNVQQGAMVPIASGLRVSSGDFDFTNIPQIYQHLVLVTNGRATVASTETGIFIGFNGEYGGNSNYSSTSLHADGSSALSVRTTNQAFVGADGRVPAATSTAGVPGHMIVTIPNYSNASIFKSYLLRSHNDMSGSGHSWSSIGVWRNTGAITRMYITFGGSMEAGTTATLYGIKAGV